MLETRELRSYGNYRSEGVEMSTSMPVRWVVCALTIALMLVAGLARPGTARAEQSLFQDSFDSGFEGWTASSGVRWSNGIEYWHHPGSVQLEGAATLDRSVSTAGYHTIQLEWHVAAVGLKPGRSCLVQVDNGNGFGWATVATVDASQADTFYRGGIITLFPYSDNNPNFRIRFRGATTNGPGEYCYVDDVAVIGLPDMASTIYFDPFTHSSDLTYWSYDSGVTIAPSIYVWNGLQSARIPAGSQLSRDISTFGYASTKITWHLAATHLGASGACQVQVSNGAGWQTIAEIDGNVDDDGFFRWGVDAAGIADQTRVTLRIRNTSTNIGSACYVSDLRVSGIDSSPMLPGDPLSGAGDVARDALTEADLTNPLESPAAPVSDTAFAVPANAAPPTNVFRGTLALGLTDTRGGYDTIRDDYNIGALGPAWKHLPPDMNLRFVQRGSYLIPLTRTLVASRGAAWNDIVGPGRVWNENADLGWTRAAFPFALVEKNANCVHNGVMTFLFVNDPVAVVSNVRYQVTQETCAYHKFNMYGQLPATYYPDNQPWQDLLSGQLRIKSAFAQELDDRLPVKPFSQLATDYPGVDITQFGAGITPADLTMKGVLYKGTLYASDCGTRFGDYAFCSEMVAPSYSTAKSAFAGVAAMALTRDFGSGVPNLKIADYVDTSHAAGSWSGVTLDNTLDMATGNYDLPGTDADEAGPKLSRFFLALSDADKVSAALSFPHKADPGTTFAYHTSDTYLATRTMNDYLLSKTSDYRDIFDYLGAKVLGPLKIDPMTAGSTLRTSEGSIAGNDGRAFGGYGMFWTRDSIAKISRFLRDDRGKIGDTQVLDPGLWNASFQRDPADRGVDTDGGFKYNNGFWARRFTPADGLPCSFWVPFMSGYGGITVAMMPNGVTYFYFSDNGEFHWKQAVIAADKISPLCSAVPVVNDWTANVSSGSAFTVTGRTLQDVESIAFVQRDTGNVDHIVQENPVVMESTERVPGEFTLSAALPDSAAVGDSYIAELRLRNGELVDQLPVTVVSEEGRRESP